tara:strand:- start:3627 stop:6152 length:2526 start_codon:yes stop_codon:yes gene_type:complete
MCGYLQYRHPDRTNDEWWFIGGYVWFNADVVNVMCRSFGLHSGFKYTQQRKYPNPGLTAGKRYIDDVKCHGDEKDIDDCTFYMPGPSSSDSRQTPIRICCIVEEGSAEVVTTWQRKSCEKCNAGYVENAGVCTACENGKYSVSEARDDIPNLPNAPFQIWVDVNIACENCPQFSTSPEASTDVNYCKCNAGYEGSLNYQHTCIQCDFGKYRTESGLAPPDYTYDQTAEYYACDDCPADKVAVYDYRDGEYFRRTEEEACVSCPTGSTTQDRTAVWALYTYGCMCDKGYAATTSSYRQQTGQTCVPCVAGRYKHWVSNPFNVVQDQLGNLICSGNVCLPGTIPELSDEHASQDCLLCAAGTYSAVAGATTAEVCTDCEAGSFSGSAGSSACSQCTQGTYQGGTGATQCTECPLNSYTATDPLTQQEFTDIAHCQCRSGYYFDAEFTGSECQPCHPGFACNNNVQTPCSGNTYSTAGAFECSTCPEFTSIINNDRTAVQSCQCNTGYSGNDGGPCTACAGGTYKDTVGSAACSACGVDLYTPNPDANIICESCPLNSRAPASSDHIDDCTCNAGFEKKDNAGTPVCFSCLADKYCIGNNLARDCPPQSTSPIGSDSEHDCTCNGGYYSVNRTHHETNTFIGDEHHSDHDAIEHDGYDHHEEEHDEPHKFCASCPPNTHYCTGDQHIPCPTHTLTIKNHASSARDCLCEATYWRDGCTRDWEAPQPYVKHVYETGACAGVNLLTPADHSTKENDELNTDPQYIGKFWRQQDVTVDAVQKCERLQICDIRGDFFNLPCTQCPADIYCSVGTTHTVSEHCPEHSSADPGAGHIDDCHCLPGYKRIV